MESELEMKDENEIEIELDPIELYVYRTGSITVRGHYFFYT